MPTHKLTKVYLESIAPTDRDWSSQDSVDSNSISPMLRLKLLRADTADVAVPP